jgi:hypothetical protein
MEDEADETYYALKYPDYHTWRDRKTIRNGRWLDGSMVYTTDPEFRPYLDELRREITKDKESAEAFLRKAGIID